MEVDVDEHQSLDMSMPQKCLDRSKVSGGAQDCTRLNVGESLRLGNARVVRKVNGDSSALVGNNTI